MRYSLWFLFCLFPIYLQAQIIRGTVTDKQTGKAIPDAYIWVTSVEPQAGTLTDSTGKFRIENVKPGRHILQISHLSYLGIMAPEQVVSAGKETILQVALSPKPHALQEVEVGLNLMQTTMAGLSTNQFSVEQSQRFAAAFYDPARLAASFAGVTVTDDQANNLSIRGNSPASLLWRLEGVNIVNPHHLANAGTFTDRAAPTGGGVNVLSAQLLSHSRLLTGAFAPGYGNTIAGVMDMHLRKGNNQKREHTIQASLLGIDVATEGPISVEQGSSYLINYRYSTVGLLSALGVQFGNEEITYQDLAFHVNLPTKKAGNFSVFGIGGTSRNIFTAPEDAADWETEKDRFDINYRSELGALGFSHEVQLATRTKLTTTLAYSALSNNRTQNWNQPLFLPDQLNIADGFEEKLLSGRIEVQHYFTDNLQLNTGTITDWRTAESKLTQGSLPALDQELNFVLWQPYLNGKWQILPRLQVEAGVQMLHSTHNRSTRTDPRALLTYSLSSKQFFQLSAGQFSQLPPLGLLLQPKFINNTPGRNLGFMTSDQFVLGYTRQLSESWHLKSELYYQQHWQVPVGVNPLSTFSALNYLNEPVFAELKNLGTGKNYGIEVTAEKPLIRNYYALLAATLYNSVYTDAQGTERSTRFNGHYAVSATAGKEWHWSRNEKPKETGLHLRSIYRGGLRDTPINLAASQAALQTVYLEQEAYSVQLPAYFRLDVRLSLRTYRTNSTRLLYLDIQNVTAYQNVAFRYYDALQNKILTRYQLGIIPVIGYRVEF